MQSIIRKVSYSVIAGVILFFQPVYASESIPSEVTIDSPAEVIAEDFVRVAAVPPSWFYMLYNWVGTFDIDPNNITEQDLEKNVTDTGKRTKIKEAIEIIKKFHTYPGEHRIVKWETMPVNISLTYEPEMDVAIRQTIELIEKHTNIRFKIHEDRITENGITVDTYGIKKEHTDFCVHDYACTDLVIHGSTTYFKGDGGLRPIESIENKYFVNTLYVNQKMFDKLNYFTPNTSFTSRYGHDVHVNGATVFNDSYQPYYSMCDIYNNHENKNISRSLAAECIFRALGLTQFSLNKDSLLSQRALQIENINWIKNPTEYDLFLLNILYDKRLKSGMSQDEIKPILKQIINDLSSKKQE